MTAAATPESFETESPRIAQQNQEQIEQNRQKVVNLDDYTLELFEQIATLKAKNDLFELEKIKLNENEQNTLFEQCVDTMLEMYAM